MAPYRLNAGGIVRTCEQALALAKSYDIDIPDDIYIVFINNWQRRTPKPNISGAGMIETLTAGTNGLIFITIKRAKYRYGLTLLMSSDESIVAHVAHELHELNSLRTLFEDNEYLSARQLVRLIHPLHEGGFKGNLHDQAWDVSDRLIAKMRNE